MLIRISLLRSICYVFTEGRISNELVDTLNWITNPELMLFDYGLPILIQQLSCGLYYFTLPFGPRR